VKIFCRNSKHWLSALLLFCSTFGLLVLVSSCSSGTAINNENNFLASVKLGNYARVATIRNQDGSAADNGAEVAFIGAPTDFKPASLSSPGNLRLIATPKKDQVPVNGVTPLAGGLWDNTCQVGVSSQSNNAPDSAQYKLTSRDLEQIMKGLQELIVISIECN
jgi:hypothetical protein